MSIAVQNALLHFKKDGKGTGAVVATDASINVADREWQ
jgi:hypothetical protein